MREGRSRWRVRLPIPYFWAISRSLLSSLLSCINIFRTRTFRGADPFNGRISGGRIGLAPRITRISSGRGIRHRRLQLLNIVIVGTLDLRQNIIHLEINILILGKKLRSCTIYRTWIMGIRRVWMLLGKRRRHVSFGAFAAIDHWIRLRRCWEEPLHLHARR